MGRGAPGLRLVSRQKGPPAGSSLLPKEAYKASVLMGKSFRDIEGLEKEALR